MLVDFFIVGAARSGTTSLYNYLSKHHNIFLPKVKECNFFSMVDSLDKETYLEPKPEKEYHMRIINSLEVYHSLYEHAGNKLKGDVSPSYMWDKDTADRIYDYNPSAKIIITLRNPIQRAYSHYLMNYNTGYDKEKTFEMALRAGKNSIWGGGNMYLGMGMYLEQIRPYFKHFGNENVKVIIYEEWIQNTNTMLNDLCVFLDIPKFDFEPESSNEKHNETTNIKNIKTITFFRQNKIKATIKKIVPKESAKLIKQKFFESKTAKAEINDFTYKNLSQYYKEEVVLLEKFLNKQLTHLWNF